MAVKRKKVGILSTLQAETAPGKLSGMITLLHADWILFKTVPGTGADQTLARGEEEFVKAYAHNEARAIESRAGNSHGQDPGSGVELMMFLSAIYIELPDGSHQNPDSDCCTEYKWIAVSL